MVSSFEAISAPLTFFLPDTVYQTRILVIFSLVSLLFIHLFKNEIHKKAFLIFASILFFISASHVICAAFYLLILCLTFFISNRDFPDKLYYFIFVIALLLLSPFLIFNLFDINTIFYSFVAYYSIYRIIHYYIETKKNPDFKRTLFDYLFYTLFFPCLCHGPVERINTLIFKNTTLEDVQYGIKKILLGLFKINIYFYFLKELENISLAEVLIVYIKTINFYLLVTGDWDIIVGTSRLLGLKVRENIPHNIFLQSSLTKLWRNGNATLIDWYFSYFYIPLAKNGKWVNLKLISVFTLILGMHAFFNTLKFPSLNVICYYVLMGVWFGITLIISKEINNYFKKSEVKKLISLWPSFLRDIIYGNSMARYMANVIINFNIISFGLWYSPFYKLLTNVWRSS